MRSINYGYWLSVTLALHLCGCAIISQKPESNNTSVNLCADSAHASATSRADEQQSVKLPRRVFSYHSDSAEHRIDHLENRRHGSNNTVAYSYNTDRFAIPRKNRTVEFSLSPKSNNPWSRLHFILNDRWLLDADFSYADSTYDENRRGFTATPRLIYEFGSLKLITRYIPHIQEYNVSAVLAVYLSITF